MLKISQFLGQNICRESKAVKRRTKLQQDKLCYGNLEELTLLADVASIQPLATITKYKAQQSTHMWGMVSHIVFLRKSLLVHHYYKIQKSICMWKTPALIILMHKHTSYTDLKFLSL